MGKIKPILKAPSCANTLLATNVITASAEADKNILFFMTSLLIE
jgi:hypothetical protein